MNIAINNFYFWCDGGSVAVAQTIVADQLKPPRKTYPHRKNAEYPCIGDINTSASIPKKQVIDVYNKYVKRNLPSTTRVKS
jgi:hypothetical protein